ncbi:ABC transporter ATP-binding protein [Nocardioides sp. KR10-350]|uniref:ABC transporter ATP-binding protein n=1 Tax=Nocardioides cheoyonin TaxID=3156615 RepID=UPI0032B3A726
MDAPILSVEDLRVSVDVGGRPYPALDGVSFSLAEGEARGLVGESGSGKSLTLRAVMGLLPHGARVTGGRILFEGEDLLADGGRRQRRVRGTGISMIFQEPSVALNPVMRVGEQIYDALRRHRRHRRLSRREARDQAVHLMELVGIDQPAARLDAYPFQLSGGLRQRVMIAAGVACRPRLILCDEPTTALDVTVQAQILRLFAHLRDELGASLLYVTHDLAVVAQLCDSLTVLYAGRVMETADDLQAVFAHPHHPYTEALLKATPRIDGEVRRLEAIPGSATSVVDRPPGCPFEPRCGYATPECREGPIARTPVGASWEVACLHPVSATVSEGAS